jgi:hypothetical protein
VVLQNPLHQPLLEEQSNITPSRPLSKTQSHHGEAKNFPYYDSSITAAVVSVCSAVELHGDFIQFLDFNVIGPCSLMPFLQRKSSEQLSRGLFIRRFSSPSYLQTCTNLVQELENHVQSCFPGRTANDGASDGTNAVSQVSPFRKRKNRISLGVKAARAGTSLQSDVSDTENEVEAKSLVEGPDATIRPYLKGDFESYDQGDGTEDVSPEGDADAKELEVVEAIEEDMQSAAGEEVSEIPKSSQPVESSDINSDAILSTEIPDATSETVVLEEPTLLGSPSPAPTPTATPSPAKLPYIKTNLGLATSTKKYLFPKLTPIETFEDYLQNPGEMEYKELYHRTSRFAQVLIAYQSEYDAIDQEIIEYESVVKAEAKRAVEDGKEEADRILELEDQARDELQEKYRDQLLLRPKDWQIFIKGLTSKRSTTAETLKHLNNLRNPAFMEAVKKRRNRTAPRTARRLQDEPVPEYKLTKEEHDFEKRKLGRLLDSLKFDDMKMADVYGFEYSAHPSHYGNQPLDRATRQPQKFQRKNGDSNGMSENATGPPSAGRLRAQRTKTKRLYDVDDSGTSDGEEEVPVKRARRPKIFEDGATASPKASPQTVGIMPAAKRTFPSGKRVGRPPKAYSQSKLQAVQTAQELVDFTSDIQGAQLANNVGESASAAPADVTTAKKKHPGGRPKKVLAPSESAPVETPKTRNKGGRPRKNRTRETTPSQDGTVLVSTVKDEHSSAANMVQLGDADDVMQSTEVEEASRGNSPATSRPSTSSSSETASSFAGTRRSARASTRTKTLAREFSTRSADDDMMANADNSMLSSASSSKDKRKRGTADTEPSPIIVEAPFQFDEPAPKRRRTKAPKVEVSEGLASEMGPKRKRKSVATPGESVAKRARKSFLDSADAGEAYEEDALLSPLARKELAAKKAQLEKSRKLSIRTKARWASGGMAKAQETRRANLAIKKAAKEAAAAAAAAAEAAGSSNLVSIQPAPPVAPATQPEPVPSHQPILPRPKTPPVEGGRAPSTRVKKPTRIAAGLDGVVDDFDDDLDDLASEYDRYQALTSAGSPVLGKRVRRPLVDLSAMMGETSDEDYY